MRMMCLIALMGLAAACSDDAAEGPDAQLVDAPVADATPPADGDTACVTDEDCGAHGVCGDTGTCGCEGGWQRVPGACEVPWWNVRYNQRRRIEIANVAPTQLPTHYTVELELDHATLVANGEAQADGTDLRIIHFDGETQGEIARRLPFLGMWNSPGTSVLFRTQDTMAMGETSEDAYWLYFDAPTATSAPNESQAEVFDPENGVPYEAADPSRELLSGRNEGGFYSVQFRRKDTGPTDYEVYVRDRTYDPTAHASVVVRDIDDILRVQTNYDSTIGDFASPGTRADGFVFLGVGAFYVQLEVSDATDAQVYFGDSGISYGAAGGGSETRYYYVRQQVTPEPTTALE